MSTPISLSFAKSPKAKSDTVVVFAADKGKLLTSGVALDKKSGGLISAALETRDGFKGRHGDVLSVILPKAVGYSQALVIGLGDLAKADILAFENAGGKTYTALKAISAKTVCVLFDTDKSVKVKEADAAAAYMSGLRLRDYNFDKYKTASKKDKSGDGKKNDELKNVTIVTSVNTAAAKAYEDYDAIAKGVLFARDLVNEVPNVLYPESYAAILAKEFKPLGVQVEIMDDLCIGYVVFFCVV